VTKEGGSFCCDIWYLANTFYGLVHPKAFAPFSNGNFNATGGPSSSWIGIETKLKLDKAKKHNPLPVSYSEYDLLFDRMLE
jgi:hypothetical protein